MTCIKYVEKGLIGKSGRLQRKSDLLNLILTRVWVSTLLKKVSIHSLKYNKEHLTSKYVFTKLHSMSMTVNETSSVLTN